VEQGCSNLESVLPQQIVGQELALSHLTDAVCHHLSQQNPKKPLVISVHGPPGVGKTYTHWWMARCLYNKSPSVDLQCPGMHCKGYKVSLATIAGCCSKAAG
jgi:ATP-dependent Clp protease ATP-binding subunit ClpA